MATTATDPATRSAAKLTPKLWGILAVVLIADAIDLMDSTITNIAAPTIVGEIGGGESLVKWLGASYSLALGVLLVVGGRLGDRYGKRRLFLIGVAGFGLASLAAALAFDPTVLVLARVVQGGFGALLIPQGIGILIATFSREQFPTAASMFGPVLGGASIIGPVLAGFLIGGDWFGLSWRPMFLINIVLCAAAYVAGHFILPKDEDLRPVSIDGIGSGLLGLSMFGLIYGLIEGSTDGWTAVPFSAIAIGIAALVGFARRQVRVANPLIEPTLLRNRGFTSGLLLGLGYFAAVNGFAYVIALYYQAQLRLSAEGAALAMTPMMIGIIGASFIARPLIPKLGRTLVVIGLATTVAAIAAMLVTVGVAGAGVTQWQLAPSVLVLGISMGLCFSSIYDVAIGDVDAAQAGSASGSLSAVQQLAAAIGSATVTTVYFRAVAGSNATAPLTHSLWAVGLIALVCCGLVWLLPKRAQEVAGF